MDFLCPLIQVSQKISFGTSLRSAIQRQKTTFSVSRVPQKEIATAPLSFAYPHAVEPRNDHTGHRSSVILLLPWFGI